MSPQEIAMKFMSASATCKGDKCPCRTTCNGKGETCGLKEVALTIRALLADIEYHKAQVQALSDKIKNMNQQMDDLTNYANQLERINDDYYRLVVSFQNGVRPKSKVKRRKATKSITRKVRRRKDPVEMDGDPRYAKPAKPPKKELPVVVI